MSKKQKSTSKKTVSKNAKQAGRGKRGRPAPVGTTSTMTDTVEGTTDASVSRLPAVGTVIAKRDRYGAIRCQCTIVEDGVRYKGRVFRSLSGAAMAAATDLGLKNKTQNGFTFWGLTKPTRTLDDPQAAVKKASDRFQKLAAMALKGAGDANRPRVRAALEAHGNAVESLLGEVA